MRALLITAVAAVAAFSQPAQADWEWTRWGMTRAEAWEASQGKAVSPSPSEKQRRMYRRSFVPVQVPEMVVDTRLAGNDFRAYLLFDVTTAKLVCVDMIALSSVMLNPSLRNTLTAAYGEPVSEQRKELPGVEWTTTTWVHGRDMIELQQGGLGNKVKYCQRDKDAVAELR